MSETNQTTRGKPRKPTKKAVLSVVRTYLRKKAPAGYSLEVPRDGVMYVSDGVEKEHDRWYVQFKPDPEYIAETRRQEFLGILAEVQDMVHKKHQWTVYLTSMLPTV